MALAGKSVTMSETNGIRAIHVFLFGLAVAVGSAAQTAAVVVALCSGNN